MHGPLDLQYCTLQYCTVLYLAAGLLARAAHATPRRDTRAFRVESGFGRERIQLAGWLAGWLARLIFLSKPRRETKSAEQPSAAMAQQPARARQAGRQAGGQATQLLVTSHMPHASPARRG